MAGHILKEVGQGVYKIILNRPDKYNAVNLQMFRDWSAAFREASADDTVRVTVVTGKGKYFSAGNDLDNFKSGSSASSGSLGPSGFDPFLYNFVKSVIDDKKPIIALVNGPAVGVGCTLLGLSDFVLASDEATFLTPFCYLGVSPELCSTFTFPRLMGNKATDLLIAGKQLTAVEAFHYNLVTRVVPHAQFEKEGQALVDTIAALPPQAVQLSKRLVQSHVIDQLHLTNENECAALTVLVNSKECRDAVRKVMNRRGRTELLHILNV